MRDDAAKRAAMLRSLMLAALDRPYTAGQIPEPTRAQKEAFADAFVEASRPYHERATPSANEQRSLF